MSTGADHPGARLPLSGLAWVAGLFCLVVGGFMLVQHARLRAREPLRPAELIDAKERLRAAPGDEVLKQQIRELDLVLRHRYFRHLGLNLHGGWLLLAGGAVLVIAGGAAAGSRRTPPPPAHAHSTPDPVELRRRTRRTVAVAGAAALATFALWSVAVRPALPASAAELERLMSETGSGAAPAGPPLAEVMRNWPRFRGPLGDGVAGCTNAPVTWNATNGAGIVWTVPVPTPGNSSPVVWGGRVFLTGGTAAGREVACFDADHGTLLWKRAVPVPAAAGASPAPEIPEGTGFASSTPATDGERVFAMFATGELAAFDFAGSLVWSKSFGPLQNLYGHATSLLVWHGRLVVQLDQGDGSTGRSRVYALDPATGGVIWEQRRALPSSWATPIVIDAAGQAVVVTCGEPWVIAYALAQGEELWKADCLGSDLAPSPIFAGGLVVAVSPGKHLVALRPDGQGDVTSTHVAWTSEEATPDITSPVSDGERVYAVTTDGTLTCLALATGKRIWSHPLKLEFNASPTRVGDKLYLIASDGVGVVLATGDTYREIARSDLGEVVRASPAFVGDRIYIRGSEHLFCIGARPAS